MTSTILLKIPHYQLVMINASQEKEAQASFFPSCILKWRRKKLWVKPAQNSSSSKLLALQSQKWLIDCLQKSAVQIICLDPAIGDTAIKTWADACEQANKTVFLTVPVNSQLKYENSFCWQLKRCVDWMAAVLLLILLCPVMIVLASLIKFTSPGPIFFRQWRVGKRGKLFRIYKFRTMIANAEMLHHQVMAEQNGLHKCKVDPRLTPLGGWLRRFSLDELPQLINVLQGQMSLVGPRPWALYDAVRISPDGQKRLRALPGITGAWQVSTRATLLDLEAVTQCDLNYLNTWSLWQDFQVLLKTIPTVFSGLGAY